MSGKCEWMDEDGVWATDCGNLFELNAGTPCENDMKYCPYCGKQLAQMANVEAANASLEGRAAFGASARSDCCAANVNYEERTDK